MKSFFIGNLEVKLPVNQGGMGVGVSLSGLALAVANPFDLPSCLTGESKTKLVPIVSFSRAAKIRCGKWRNKYGYLPDVIVVEGSKAGGQLKEGCICRS